MRGDDLISGSEIARAIDVTEGEIVEQSSTVACLLWAVAGR